MVWRDIAKMIGHVFLLLQFKAIFVACVSHSSHSTHLKLAQFSVALGSNQNCMDRKGLYKTRYKMCHHIKQSIKRVI